MRSKNKSIKNKELTIIKEDPEEVSELDLLQAIMPHDKTNANGTLK